MPKTTKRAKSTTQVCKNNFAEHEQMSECVSVEAALENELLDAFRIGRQE